MKHVHASLIKDQGKSKARVGGSSACRGEQSTLGGTAAVNGFQARGRAERPLRGNVRERDRSEDQWLRQAAISCDFFSFLFLVVFFPREMMRNEVWSAAQKHFGGWRLYIANYVLFCLQWKLGWCGSSNVFKAPIPDTVIGAMLPDEVTMVCREEPEDKSSDYSDSLSSPDGGLFDWSKSYDQRLVKDDCTVQLIMVVYSEVVHLAGSWWKVALLCCSRLLSSGKEDGRLWINQRVHSCFSKWWMAPTNLNAKYSTCFKHTSL